MDLRSNLWKQYDGNQAKRFWGEASAVKASRRRRAVLLKTKTVDRNGKVVISNSAMGIEGLRTLLSIWWLEDL